MAHKHSPSENTQRSGDEVAPATNRPTQSPSLLDRSGLIILDKPAGASSHDMVAKIRRIMGTKKVGHSGTLDPMATGVLVLGIERGTKFLAHVVTHDKRYEATMAFGASTVTDDVEGEVLQTADPTEIDSFTVETMTARLSEIFADFQGEIMQRPTSVSSIKINGRRAHELVREGQEVDIPPRPITIHSLSFSDVRREETTEGPRWLVDVSVHCSSGTYIRAIARDVGEALGLGGYLTALRRTSVGPFDIAEAVTLDELAETPTLGLSLDAAMQVCFPTRSITEGQAADLALGKWLDPIGLKGVHAAVDPQGHAIALIKEKERRAASEFVARPHGLV